MQFLDATNDVAFKKLFGDQKHSDLTIAFLNSVLGLSEGKLISCVTINSNDNMPLTLDGKESALDVYCTDQEGSHYIIEMQRINQGDFLQRAQYYVGDKYSRQLKKLGKYKTLLPVIFVGVLRDFSLFDNPHYLTHHIITDAETGQRTMFHNEYHFIELQKFNKSEAELTSIIDKWTHLFKHAYEQDKIPAFATTAPELKTAFEVLNRATWDERDFDAYVAEQEFLFKEEKIKDTALEEGIIKGEKKKAIEVTQQMLDKKLPVEMIAEITGLTLEEIKKLS